MNSYEVGIERFILEGWRAIKAGYRPGYMECLAYAVSNGVDVIKLPIDMLRDFENPWHMTVGEICTSAIRFAVCTVVATTYPLAVFLWSAIMKYNVDCWVKRQEEFEDDK